MQFSKEEDTLFTLAIPNKLLYTWHKGKNPTTSFAALVNSKIRGRMTRLKCCPRINERLRSQSARIASQYCKGTYQQCQKVLQHKYNFHMFEGECDHFDDIEHEQLQKNVTHRDQ